MVSFVRTAYNNFLQISSKPSIHRTLLYSLVPLSLTQKNNRHLGYATLGQMAQEGRLSNDTLFSKWIREIYDVGTPETAQQYFLKAEFYDLMCKVIVSTAFYFTAHVSLRRSLERIFALSPTTKPIPIPSSIAFAPVVFKLIHIASIHFEASDQVKRTTQKIAHGLEALWHLRFALIALGASENIVYTLSSSVFRRMVNHFIPYPDVVLCALWVSKLRYKEVPSLTPMYNLLTGIEFIAPTGFNAGIDGMMSSLFASTAPSDRHKLEQLLFGVKDRNAQANVAEALRAGQINNIESKALIEQIKTIEKI